MLLSAASPSLLLVLCAYSRLGLVRASERRDSLESIWETMPPVAPCWPGLVPARSEKDSSLAKAEPICKGDSASEIISLGIHARNSLAETRAGEKEERRCCRHHSRSFSANTEENNGLAGSRPPFCAIGEQMCPCSPSAPTREADNVLTTARNKVPRRGSLSPPACWGRELEEQRRENLWLRIKANLPGNQKPHMQAKLATPSLLPAPMPQWAHLPLCCLLPPHRLHCWSAQPALLGLPCQDSVQQACQIMVVVKQCPCRHRAAAHSVRPWG